MGQVISFSKIYPLSNRYCTASKTTTQHLKQSRFISIMPSGFYSLSCIERASEYSAPTSEDRDSALPLPPAGRGATPALPPRWNSACCLYNQTKLFRLERPASKAVRDGHFANSFATYLIWGIPAASVQTWAAQA